MRENQDFCPCPALRAARALADDIANRVKLMRCYQLRSAVYRLVFAKPPSWVEQRTKSCEWSESQVWRNRRLAAGREPRRGPFPECIVPSREEREHLRAHLPPGWRRGTLDRPGQAYQMLASTGTSLSSRWCRVRFLGRRRRRCERRTGRCLRWGRGRRSDG